MRGDVQDGAPSRPQSTWASLRLPDYRHLFTAGALIYFAVQAQQVARGQLAYELAGSNTGLGVVYLGFGIPMLVLTPVGGVAADRLSKRTVLLGAQTCLVLSAAWIAIAGALGALEYWMLVGAAVLQGAGFAIYGPTQVAFTGELVPRSLLGNAVALTQLSLNGTRVLGPALAGLAIAIKPVGTTGVYLATSVLIGCSVVSSFLLPKRPPADRSSQGSVLDEFADGIRFVRRNHLLRMLIVTSFVMVMAAWPYLAFLPAVANDTFGAGPIGLGLMSSVSAIAALVVTYLIAGRARGDQSWRIQAVSGVVLGLGLLGIAVAPTFGVALVAMAIVGGAASGYQAMNNTIVLKLTAVEYHGRVQSLLMLSFSGFGIAALPLGAAADAVGLRLVFVVMGLVCLVTMACYLGAQSRFRKSGGTFDLAQPSR